MATKQKEPQWLSNFRKFLRSKFIDDKLPKEVVDYLQPYMDKLVSQRNEILVLEEKNRNLLKIIESITTDNAFIKVVNDRLKSENEKLERQIIQFAGTSDGVEVGG